MDLLTHFLGDRLVLEPWRAVFAKEGITTLPLLCAMTADDLRQCGLPVGPVRAVLQEIQTHCRVQAQRKSAAENLFLQHLQVPKYQTFLLKKLRNDLWFLLKEGRLGFLVVPSFGDLLLPPQPTQVSAASRVDLCNKVGEFLELCHADAKETQSLLDLLYQWWTIEDGTHWDQVIEMANDVALIQVPRVASWLEKRWSEDVNPRLIVKRMETHLQAHDVSVLLGIVCRLCKSWRVNHCGKLLELEKGYRCLLAHSLQGRRPQEVDWSTHAALVELLTEFLSPNESFRLRAILREADTQQWICRGQVAVQTCALGVWPDHDAFHWKTPLWHVPAVLQRLFMHKMLEGEMPRLTHSYKKNVKEHKIVWINPNAGSALVELQSGTGKAVTLCVSTWQMMILQLLGDNQIWECDKILVRLHGKARVQDVAHHLLSMAHPKVGILLKRPPTKELTPQSLFRLNPKLFKRYSTDTTHNLPLMPPLTQEQLGAFERIQQNQTRQKNHALQQRILHEMKMHKKIPLKTLLHKAQGLVSPPVPWRIAKENVMHLVEEEYIKLFRDEQDTEIAQYCP